MANEALEKILNKQQQIEDRINKELEEIIKRKKESYQKSLTAHDADD